MIFFTYETALESLRDEVYKDAVEHGLWNAIEHQAQNIYGSVPESETTIRRQLAADRIASEVAELREAAISKTHFEEELADVIIMALSVAGHFGIDIGEAVEKKRLVNKSRSYEHEGE